MDYPWLNNEEKLHSFTPSHIYYSNTCKAAPLLYMQVLEYIGVKIR